MMAIRALLFAVFGGFIGAAPVAPVVAGAEGSCAPKQTQKNERPGCDVAERPAPSVAAAPPSAGAAPAAVAPPPARETQAPRAAALEASTGRSGSVPPPAADVRAGHLGLPPPAR
jgi:hypothetical protein